MSPTSSNSGGAAARCGGDSVAYYVACILHCGKREVPILVRFLILFQAIDIFNLECVPNLRIAMVVLILDCLCTSK